MCYNNVEASTIPPQDYNNIFFLEWHSFRPCCLFRVYVIQIHNDKWYGNRYERRDSYHPISKKKIIPLKHTVGTIYSFFLFIFGKELFLVIIIIIVIIIYPLLRKNRKDISRNLYMGNKMVKGARDVCKSCVECKVFSIWFSALCYIPGFSVYLYWKKITWTTLQQGKKMKIGMQSVYLRLCTHPFSST